MASAIAPNVRDLVTGTGAFGPAEVRSMLDALGTDAGLHRDLREAVRELESQSDRSPATAVRLGVCQYLLGRCKDAIDTLRAADGGALALFHQGLAHLATGAHEAAQGCFEAAKKAGYDAAACAGGIARSLRAIGQSEEAARVVHELGNDSSDSAEYWVAKGDVLADSGADVADVIDSYEKALAIDPGHPGALFAMGVLNDRLGNDEEAEASYEKALQRYPASVGALINLGVLYEDRDDFAKAQRCYRRVLEAFPDHPRARLFLKDCTASDDLLTTEQEQKQRDRLDHVLSLPVSDFELSVRSRNCLQKMGIHTLGDLARTSEAEILASKNFGETSLSEIKDMLASKALSLGMLSEAVVEEEAFLEPAEPSADDQETYAASISELNLSVRARKCMTKLGINTIGELLRRTGEDLMECKNFGVTSLNEVREKLTERGLRLRGD
jgi:DNA-directed RNA polymerase subunit alpha